MCKTFGNILFIFVILSYLIIDIPFVFAKDRTFSGKVIDFDTKEAIEGAVVVAYWYEERPTATSTDTRLKEVKETLTDNNGEWFITGEEEEPYDPNPYISFLLGIYYTRHPLFVIFKPGYCSWPKGFSIDPCKGKMKPNKLREIKEGKTVELLKLTKKEDRIMAKPAPEGEKEDWKKQKLLIKLIREEWRYLHSEDPKDLYKIEKEQNEK
jgi:hypothetical protein